MSKSPGGSDYVALYDARSSPDTETQEAAEDQMVEVLAESGIIFAYESALLAAARNKHLKSIDLIEFVAKQIESFGRQWTAGYINKERYLSPTRRRTRDTFPDDEHSEEQSEFESGGIAINQEEWEGDITEAWPSPMSPSSYEGRQSEKSGQDEDDAERLAATKIEAVARGRQDRKRVQELKEQRKAAIKIEAVARGRQDRKRVEEMKEQREAAVKIEAVARGRKDRRRVEVMRKENEAAIKIEAVARGRKDRKRVHDLKRSKAAIEEVGEDQGTNEEAENKRREEEDAEKKRLEKDAEEKRVEEDAEKKRLEKDAEEETDKKKNESATKIAAVSRGHKDRALLKQKHDSATKIQALARGRSTRKEHHKHLQPWEVVQPEEAKPPINGEKLAPKPKVKKKKVYKSKTKLPLPKVQKYIASMYEKKCKADKIDDQKGNDRDTLLEFCEDFFSQSFGMPALAGKKRYELEMGVKTFAPTDIRIRWFGTMIGWVEETVHEGITTPHNEDAIDAYLYILEATIPVNSIDETLDDNPCLIPLEKFIQGVSTLFKDSMDHVIVKDLISSVRSKTMDPGKESIEYDPSMELLMRAWYAFDDDEKPKPPRGAKKTVK